MFNASRIWAGCLVVLAGALGCGPQQDAPAARPEVAIYAAASLRDALEELVPRIEADLAVEVTLNLGSSGDLARQIVAGGKADVFLSADVKEMDRVASLIEPGTRRDLLTNGLVVIEPLDPTAPRASSFREPFDASQLAQPAIERLSLANVDTVPAGRYAKAWLEARGVWNDVRERVLPGVDVRAALAAVESGGAQAGIVYRTDAARSKRVRTVHAIAREAGPAIVYPIAMLAGRQEAQAARRVVDFLEGPIAEQAFERFGFEVLDAVH